MFVQELEDLKDRLMLKIQESAVNMDIEAIEHLSGMAKQIQRDLLIVHEIEERVTDYRSFLSTGISTMGSTRALNREVPIVQKQTSTNSGDLSDMAKGRMEAQLARERWEASCKSKGILLQPESRTTYRIHKGRIAVPFANEKTPDKWFLGIKEGMRKNSCPYFAIVCICRTLAEENLHFVLPISHIQPVWSSLSRSHGDVKLNIVREDAEFYLVVPPRKRIPINHCLNDFESIV